MDDFILLCNSKEIAKDLKIKIQEFVENNLHLNLNKKTNYYPNSMGINFCGYRIYETHILLRTRSKKKIKKNIKKWNCKYNENNVDILKVRMQFNSWLAHSRHANSYKLRKKAFDNILFKDELLKLNVKIEN